MLLLCFFVWILCLFFSINKVNKKNQKFDVDHCALEHHHPTVTFYIIDVTKTNKAMNIHQPIFTDSLLHQLFLTPKIEYLTRNDQVWYMNILVGKNMFCLLSKQLTNDLFSLKDKQITNKTSKSLEWWMHLFQLSMA